MFVTSEASTSITIRHTQSLVVVTLECVILRSYRGGGIATAVRGCPSCCVPSTFSGKLKVASHSVSAVAFLNFKHRVSAPFARAVVRRPEGSTVGAIRCAVLKPR